MGMRSSRETATRSFGGRRMTGIRASAVVLACLAAALAGCDRGPAVAQVSGKVLYPDGSVPKGGICTVQFVPITSVEVRKAATGFISPDGSFEMYTRKPGDGVFLGEYAVTFAVWKGPMEPVSLIEEKYTAPATTPYKVTVDGDMHDLQFEIEPARATGPKLGA